MDGKILRHLQKDCYGNFMYRPTESLLKGKCGSCGCNLTKEGLDNCDTAKFILRDKIKSDELTKQDKAEIMEEVNYCLNKNK